MRKLLKLSALALCAAGLCIGRAGACDTVALSTHVVAPAAIVSPLVLTAAPLVAVDAFDVRVQAACAAASRVQVFSARSARRATVVRQRVRVFVR